MSVVNKMLQDLEQRQSQDSPANANYQPTVRASKVPYWIVMAALVALLGLLAWWVKGGHFSQTTPLAKSMSGDQNFPSQPQPQPQAMSAAQSKAEQPLASQEKTRSAPADEPNQPAQPAALVRQDLNKTEISAATEQQKAEPGQGASQVARSAMVPIAAPQITIKDQTDDLVTQNSNAAQPVFNITSNRHSDSLANLKQQAQVAVKQGNNQQAIPLLEKIVLQEPQNRAARKKLAALLFAQDQKIKAQQILTEGLNLQPDGLDMRLMLARVYVQSKDNHTAHKVLSDYPVNTALHPDLVSYRASLAQQIDQYGAARQDYLSLIDSQPSNSKWWLGLGICEEKLGNSSAALQAYQKVQGSEQLAIEVRQFVQQRIRYLAGGQ